MLQIRCCIRNLTTHQYGAQLDELAEEGFDIQLDACQSQCTGCNMQPAFTADGKWYGVSGRERLKEKVYDVCRAKEGKGQCGI
ncbi:hypothetical protein [Paenibacillus spongiae]|uniref:DUF1450 domain-containing protein n=1 Tax=Paenibacillus spongiae TaxID=2909671 RepID=A0ABY5S0V5_9BACL|nr:hypothetical protein [Paenibacillus spongiae]UVI27481.1 hypothetical protein L1F29_18600 [Paenibacillus spongiae]